MLSRRAFPHPYVLLGDLLAASVFAIFMLRDRGLPAFDVDRSEFLVWAVAASVGLVSNVALTHVQRLRGRPA